jgi:hypothetical protein
VLKQPHGGCQAQNRSTQNAEWKIGDAKSVSDDAVSVCAAAHGAVIREVVTQPGLNQQYRS